MAFQPSIVDYPEGSVIYSEGDPASNFFIVLSGEIKVSRKTGDVGSSGRETRLGKGDVFAASSGLLGRVHIDTAEALSAVKLLAVEPAQFEPMLEEKKSTAINMLTQFAALIRDLNAIFAAQKDKPTVNNSISEKSRGEDNYTQDGSKRIYPEGAVIFNEGDEGEFFFVINSGMVKITKTLGKNEVTLAFLKAGAIFGEMSVMQSEPRSATAYAYTQCELTAIAKENFDRVLEQPKTALNLTLMLADRVWFLFKQLSNQKITSTKERLCDMLAVNLQRDGVRESIMGHTFNFNLAQLSEMTRIPLIETAKDINTLIQEGVIQMEGERVRVKSTVEIIRRNEVYWKLHR